MLRSLASYSQTQRHQIKNSARMKPATKKASPDILTLVIAGWNYLSSNAFSTFWFTGQVIVLELNCISCLPVSVEHARKADSWITIWNVNGSPAYYKAVFASYMMRSIFFFCPNSHGKAFGTYCKRHCLLKVQTVGFTRWFPDF